MAYTRKETTGRLGRPLVIWESRDWYAMALQVNNRGGWSAWINEQGEPRRLGGATREECIEAVEREIALKQRARSTPPERSAP